MPKFMSVTKFVDYFYSKFKADKFNVTSATLYFEDKKCFINKYKNSCIKPVFIEFRDSLYNYHTRAKEDKRDCLTCKYMTHQEILDEFGDPQSGSEHAHDVLIISFKESKKKTLPTEKNGKLYCMNIDFNQSSYKGIKYYPTEIEESTCEHNNKKVRQQIIAENNEPGLIEIA